VLAIGRAGLKADATDAAALGLAPLRATRHGVWVNYSFLPDTPCA